MKSLLALHSATSGTEIDGGVADEAREDMADNILFYVDDAGDSAFGRSAIWFLMVTLCCLSDVALST